MFGCDCMGQNCNVVSRCPKCIHVTGDVLGMNGLQVTASGLEISVLPLHDCGSGCPICRTVEPSCSWDKKSEQPTRRYTPKPKESLRKYTVTWPPAHVQLCSICSSEHPGYSHCALCHTRTQQTVGRSHIQEGGLQKCATLDPTSNPKNSRMLVACKNCLLGKPIFYKLVKNFIRDL